MSATRVASTNDRRPCDDTPQERFHEEGPGALVRESVLLAAWRPSTGVAVPVCFPPRSPTIVPSRCVGFCEPLERHGDTRQDDGFGSYGESLFVGLAGLAWMTKAH